MIPYQNQDKLLFGNKYPEIGCSPFTGSGRGIGKYQTISYFFSYICCEFSLCDFGQNFGEYKFPVAR